MFPYAALRHEKHLFYFSQDFCDLSFNFLSNGASQEMQETIKQQKCKEKKRIAK